MRIIIAALAMLALVGCDRSTRIDDPALPPATERVVTPPPTDSRTPTSLPAGATRPLNIKAVMESLKGRMVALSEKYPELGSPRDINIGQIPLSSDIYGLEYAHNSRRVASGYQDTGPAAAHVRFVVFPLAKKDTRESDRVMQPMEQPDVELARLGVGLISRLHVGTDPSKGFEDEMKAIMLEHVRHLQDIDRAEPK
jgi:hypothetical protein